MTKLSIKFEPRDLWVGAYWNVKEERFGTGVYPKRYFTVQKNFYLYVCLFPCFPVCLKITLESNRCQCPECNWEED